MSSYQDKKPRRPFWAVSASWFLQAVLLQPGLSHFRSDQLGERDAPEELAVDIDLNRRVGDDNAEVDGLLVEVQKLRKRNLADAIGGVDDELVTVLREIRQGLTQEGHIRDLRAQKHGISAVVLRKQLDRSLGPVRRSAAGIGRGLDRRRFGRLVGAFQHEVTAALDKDFECLGINLGNLGVMVTSA